MNKHALLICIESSLINQFEFIDFTREYAGYISRTTYHVMTDGVKITVLTNQIPQFMRSVLRFNYMYNKLSVLIQRICLNSKVKLIIIGKTEITKNLDR